MGQYGRAALSVAPTHKKRLPQTTVSKKKERAFTQRHTPPVSLSAATPLKEGGYAQRTTSRSVPQGIVKFCRSFFPKAGFLPSFFT